MMGNRGGAFRLLSFLILTLLAVLCCSGRPAGEESVSGTAALEHVREMVRFGPHPPGSPAQAQVGSYIEGQLKSFGLDVERQEFESATPLGRLKMANVIGRLAGPSDRVILLASHYDSKYFKEFEFVGANDGGSSSGLLLELARVLAKRNPTDHTLWFVFFDGEEAIADWTSIDSLYGSRHLARRLQRSGQLGRLSAMILLDLVGSPDIRLRKDSNSTQWLSEIIWDTADEMGHNELFLPRGSVSAVDDHVPFAELGVPVVDLIDLNYRYWHTPEDTIEKLSAATLETIGNVVLASLPKISTRVGSPGTRP